LGRARAPDLLPTENDCMKVYLPLVF